eukprot:137222_1
MNNGYQIILNNLMYFAIVIAHTNGSINNLFRDIFVNHVNLFLQTSELSNLYRTDHQFNNYVLPTLCHNRAKTNEIMYNTIKHLSQCVNVVCDHTSPTCLADHALHFMFMNKNISDLEYYVALFFID